MLTLDTLGTGRTARIETIAIDGTRGLHLMEMGLTPGTDVSVARLAPFGDPIDIVVRGYHLSLRKSEARRVRVAASCLGDALT